MKKASSTKVRKNLTAQRGFTFIELSVVLAIIAILGALIVPKVTNYIQSNSAPQVAQVVQKVVNTTRVTRQNGDTWSTASNTELASIVKSDGRLTISGTTVSLGLGASSTLSLAAGTISTSNDAGQLTATNISEDACPTYTAAISKFVDVITVNGTSVKALNANYLGSSTSAACVSGDTNSIVALYR
jgi:type IV pilus assembly protein PilA